jgi:alpha-galactosidase
MKRVGFGKGLVENVGLLNLGKPECCDWLIETIDRKIKEFGIGVYRQDFNFPPLLWWRQNDEENRRGMLENLYIQGYLRFWDELLLRNPGLWINSVSSGGRRSDLETLSRSVSLHESDFAHGNHPILQAILANTFMWQPYCGSFATSWDDDDGEYLPWYGALPHNSFDNYMAHCAMAPAVLVFAETLGLDNYRDGDDSAIQSYQTFRKLWKRAAPIMLRGDFYLLALSDRTNRCFHAIQFHDEDTGSGFIEVIRNARCPEESILLHPRQMDPEADYVFESPEFGKHREAKGSELLENGFSVSLAQRSGEIWFYRKADVGTQGNTD